VTLPKQLEVLLIDEQLLAEHEWRSLGIQQSRGWVHYGFFKPEKNVLLFRRPLPAHEPEGPAAAAAPQVMTRASLRRPPH